MQDKVIFISYDRTANYIIGSHKNIMAGRDSYLSSDINLINEFPHKYYFIGKEILTPENILYAKAMNKKIIVYTINTKQDIDALHKY
jgi:hypothetical protein